MIVRRAARFACFSVLLVGGPACSVGEPAAPSLEAAPRALVDPRAMGLAVNIEELFETRILPTCALNGGVCHNSNTYPDLRHLAALEELVEATVNGRLQGCRAEEGSNGVELLVVDVDEPLRHPGRISDHAR